jgi:selenocysteine lyase/cysteine desulfurase
MRVFLDDWRDHGERWEVWLQDIVDTRDLFARLIHAQSEEVACIPNVSSGLGAIASSLQFEEGSNVVVSELNFPTNIYLWHTLKARGFVDEIRVLKPQDGQIPLTAYEKAIDDKTVAVSADYVSWINGCREQIAEVTKLAHAQDALMLVDVFHAAGVLPIDVDRLEVDAIFCGTYKWLMGPHGTAFLYVNPEALTELKPSIVGWHGIKDSVIARVQSNEDPFGRPFDLTQAEPAGNATRFEWGTWAVVSVEGTKAALEFTLKYPPEERWPLIQRLNDRLVDGVRRKGMHVTSPAGKERSSGIVTFEVADAVGVAKRLMKEHVVVAPRVNTLRVSPHFYNTETEIDRFLNRI